MKIPQAITEAIQDNRLVIFVGSGLSTNFGLPNWRKLVTDIINELNDDNYKAFIGLLENNIVSPLEVLEKLKSNRNQINRYIKNNFQIKEKDIDLKLHKKLLELSGKIITTNF